MALALTSALLIHLHLPYNKYIPFTQLRCVRAWCLILLVFFCGALFVSWSYHYSGYLPPPSSSFYYRMFKYTQTHPYTTIVISSRYLDWMVGCDFIHDNQCCISCTGGTLKSPKQTVSLAHTMRNKEIQ